MSEIDPKLSRAYREASSEGPPAALDAAILAAARAQAAKPQRRARPSWWNWMAPASAIATLALGVSIALLVEREQPVTGEDRPAPQIPQQPQSAPPAAEAAKAKAADRAPAESALKKEAPAAPAPAAPAQAPALAAPTSAPRLDAPAPPAAQAFPAERRAKSSASGAAAAEVAAPKAAMESNAAGDAERGAAAAPAAPAPAATGRLAPLRQAQRSPEMWLEEIGRLKREGRDREAAEQLAEFRKAYPAYAVPESLRSK